MPFRRWLLNVSLALGVAMFVLPFPHRLLAQEQACAPIQDLQNLIQTLPVFRILQGDALKRAVVFFNNIEPVTEIPWPSAYFAIRPDGHGVLMVGTENAICAGVLIIPSAVDDVLRAIDGTGV